MFRWAIWLCRKRFVQVAWMTSSCTACLSYFKCEAWNREQLSGLVWMGVNFNQECWGIWGYWLYIWVQSTVEGTAVSFGKRITEITKLLPGRKLSIGGYRITWGLSMIFGRFMALLVQGGAGELTLSGVVRDGVEEWPVETHLFL